MGLPYTNSFKKLTGEKRKAKYIALFSLGCVIKSNGAVLIAANFIDMYIYLYKKKTLDLLYMLIIKNFSYVLPKGFASGEAVLNVFKLKNFSEN